MAETRVIQYDPAAPEAAAVRAALRTPLLVLATAKDRGRLGKHDVELFNIELEELTHRVQDDAEWAVRSLVELLFTLDHVMDRLALFGIGREKQVRHFLGDGCR